MSIEEIERYNVLANEIRELKREINTLRIGLESMEAAQERRTLRIEAQLTALRADADKGRELAEGDYDSRQRNFEEIFKRFDALDKRMMLDRIAAASHIRMRTLGLRRKKKQERKPVRKAGKR